MRPAAIERHLSRFPAEARPRLRVFAHEHPWSADLVVSFPALAAAIALAPKNAMREAAIRAVIAGAPLARIAAIAETALWLRACPPEAFAKPAPRLPDDGEFRRRIVNHFPQSWECAPRWFGAIAGAYVCADSQIAWWFAREAPRVPRPKYRNTRPRNDNDRLVALFAWLCKHQRIKAQENLTLWNADMQWRAAHAAACAWREAIMLDLLIGDDRDGWFEAARMGAYEFAPLRNARDIRAEAAAMHNCVRSYAYDIASGQRRLWSVRKDGVRVATLSLKLASGFMPAVEELSGIGNELADDEIVAVVHRWLCAQDPQRFKPSRHAYRHPNVDQKRWRALWRDYWRAKGAIPHWLPLHGSDAVFYAL